MLTGFDSKWVNTLYMDKILEYENIIQAFSRTNRLFGPDKPFGIIRYYRKPHTMEQNVSKAVKLYSGDRPIGLFVEKLSYNLGKLNAVFDDIAYLFKNAGIPDFEKLPADGTVRAKFASLFRDFNGYLEAAKIQGFRWDKHTYSFKDEESGNSIEITMEFDENAFLILAQRYKELSAASPDDPGSQDIDIPYDLVGYLTEIDTGVIDADYMNSRFDKYLKLIRQEGSSEESIEQAKAELHKTFAALTQEEQKYANIFLHDIERGDVIAEDGKRFVTTSRSTVTFGSNKTVWWKGACGHEWQTSIKARSAGEQCPICSGARVLRGYNDFESKFPELVKEWSSKNEPLRPSMITAATHRKVIWRCKLGHEWTASVKSRTVNGTGCPYCSHNFVLPGFNDLASRFPEIAAEWSERNLPLTPDQVTAFKNIKVWWKCHLGHEWNTLISTRAGGSQCPYCSGIKLLKGFNDLKTKYPSLAAEWSEKNLPLTPDAVNEKSTKNVWWKCNTCGYEWKAVVKARVKGGMCPVCAERAVLQGYNDLGTTDPHLLSEWDYEKNSKWTPSNVSRNSMKVVWWKCGAGHSYRAKITDRTIEQKGCPQCEAEFQQALPQMLIMMYGAQNGITVKSNSDSELGMRLVAYLPELHCAVDIAGATVTEKREQSVKAHICQSNRLGYYLIKRTADTSQMAAEIKTLFIRNHIYLHTDSEKDVQVLRERFLEWKTEMLVN